jgi:hypothetical protein
LCLFNLHQPFFDIVVANSDAFSYNTLDILFHTIFFEQFDQIQVEQLSFSEKNAIAALDKAGLKGPTIAQETGHQLLTVYCV